MANVTAISSKVTAPIADVLHTYCVSKLKPVAAFQRPALAFS